MYLTGKGNFRFDIAKTLNTRETVKDAPAKPIHLKHIRDYLTTKYEAIVSKGEGS